jgi:hypothetical protein
VAGGSVQLPPDSTGKQLATTLRLDGKHVEHVRDAPISPKFQSFSQTDLAAGASIDFTTAAVPVNRVGKIVSVTVASSVGLKAEVKTIVAGVPVIRDVIFTSSMRLTEQWFSPHADFISAPASSQFRVTLTNRGIDAVNVYCTIYWDEEGE